MSCPRKPRLRSSEISSPVFAAGGDINNALQLYANVLATHPGNRRATERMSETVERVLDRVERGLDEGSMAEAEARNALDTLLSYETLPESARREVRETMAQM